MSALDRQLSRRNCVTALAASVAYGAFASVFGHVVPKGAASSVIPVHSVLISFQYDVLACCPYYEPPSTKPQFPVKLEPDTRCMELFVSPPGGPEKPVDHIPGSEILGNAINPRWDGSYSRVSNPLPQGAKGIYVVRLQALTFRSMFRIGFRCKPPNANYPSVELDGSYTVLINGEQTPSLPAPNGSFKWTGQDNTSAHVQQIWTFDVS
jgi:hypothetical protein